jgi:hypothetical protein
MANKALLAILATVALTACENLGGERPPPMVCEPSVACAELECPVPQVVTKWVEVPVEVPVIVEVPATQHTSGDKELLVLGSREFITLLDSGLRLEARVDTGAETSSIHATNITPFERDGRRWVRFQIKANETEEPVTLAQRVKRTVLIRQIDAPDQRRFVVQLWTRIGEVKEKLSFTLADRSGFDYPVLLGRNFLTDTAIVDVSRKHVLQ